MAVYPTEPLPTAPYSLDLLADLHAGVLSESVSERLWPLVRQDESAMNVISALEKVTARLGEVGREHATGEPMPPEVAERIDRALAAAEPVTGTSAAVTATSTANTATSTAVPSLASRRRPRRLVAAGIGVAATVAVSAAVVTAVIVSSDGDSSAVVADGPGPEPTLVLDSDEVDASFAYRVMADRADVPLLESDALTECLAANGIGMTGTGVSGTGVDAVLGAAPVELDGRRGVVLVLPRDSTSSGLTLLAVAPDCAAGNPATLLRRDLN